MKLTHRQHVQTDTQKHTHSLATQDEREREGDGNFNCVYNLTLDYRVDWKRVREEFQLLSCK